MDPNHVPAPPHPPRRRRPAGYECVVSGVWTLKNPPKLDEDEVGADGGAWKLFEDVWMLRGASASDVEVYAPSAATPVVHAPPASSEAEGQQPQEQPAAFAN